MPKLELGAGKDQHVPQIVDAHRGLILNERLEDRHHLPDPHVAQWHDLNAESGRQRARRIAQLRRQVAAHGARGGLYLPDARVLDHGRAVAAQEHLQRRRQRFARNRAGGSYRHRSADGGLDGVRLVEDVGENVAHDVAQVGAFEVERHRRTARYRSRRWGRQSTAGKLSLDQLSGALVELGLLAAVSAVVGPGDFHRAGEWDHLDRPRARRQIAPRLRGAGRQ